MKKVVLVFAAIAITAGAYAQADSTTRKSTPRDLNNNQNQNVQNNSVDKSHPDGVMMQNGKMMKVKNGQMTSLQDPDVTMINGTKVMKDGTCIKNDGSKVMMKEGQHMDMAGNMISMNTNNDKNMDINQNMQSNPVDKSHPDGVMMQNGKIMKVKNGQMTRLDHDMTMTNGTRIMSDGTCTKKDGSKVMLKEGQHMDMSGNMVPMKTSTNKNMYLVPDSTRKSIK